MARDHEITFEEVRERLGRPGFRLVDVLPRESFEEEHIRGALSLPLAEIPRRASSVLPNRSEEIAVYCGGPT
jgi:rhodanese-related sulfurtransferase